MNYVMFGYCLSDVDKTAFLAKIPASREDPFLTDDINLAKKFSDKNMDKVKGFGSPKKWLKFVNEECIELFGDDAFKFHLVKTCL